MKNNYDQMLENEHFRAFLFNFKISANYFSAARGDEKALLICIASGFKAGYNARAEQMNHGDIKNPGGSVTRCGDKLLWAERPRELAQPPNEERSEIGACRREISKLTLEVKLLKRVIAKELTENDELGAEYTYVVALREEVRRLKEALKFYATYEHWITADGRPPTPGYIEVDKDLGDLARKALEWK